MYRAALSNGSGKSQVHISSEAVKISIFKSLSDALHTPQICGVDTPAPHCSELLCSRSCSDRHYIKASEYINNFCPHRLLGKNVCDVHFKAASQCICTRNQVKIAEATIILALAKFFQCLPLKSQQCAFNIAAFWYITCDYLKLRIYFTVSGEHFVLCFRRVLKIIII